MNHKEHKGRKGQARLLMAVALFFLALVFVSNGADVQAATGQAPVKVAFELFQNNILVPVSLNGGETSWFVFDTGASISVVDAEWAAKSRLAAKGSATLGAGGGNLEAKFVEGVSIGLPGLVATNQMLAVAPLDMLPPLFGRNVRGILGNNFIKDYVVEMDYAGRTLVFHPHGKYSLAGNPQALPLENRNGTPYLPVEIFLTNQESISGLFEIDSGSVSALTINKPFADAHGIPGRLPANLKAEGQGGAGLGGDMKAMDARVHQLQIGGHLLREPVINISQDAAGFGTGAEAGFMGGEILRRFTVILDLQSGRVLLRPNQDLNDSFDVDMSGMELMTAPGDFKAVRIKTIRAGFPAAVAGLKPGDRIVSVDGRPAGDVGLDDLARMFRQDGKSYDLLIQREDKNLRIQLKLKRIL